MNALERLLRQAERIWSHGERIPLDLAQSLMDLGADVEALEQQYLNS